MQVTPKEISDITFIKPTHKRGVQSVSCAEEDPETQPAKRIPESGPQDAPRLPVQKLISALFEVVPQACLFTVVEPPLTSEETLPTIEQAQDQLEVPKLSSCISSTMDDDYTDEQGNEQRAEERVGEQSEEQSAEHVGEEQRAEPPPSISEPIDHPEAGGGNLPLPLSEHYSTGSDKVG